MPPTWGRDVPVACRRAQRTPTTTQPACFGRCRGYLAAKNGKTHKTKGVFFFSRPRFGVVGVTESSRFDRRFGFYCAAVPPLIAINSGIGGRGRPCCSVAQPPCAVPLVSRECWFYLEKGKKHRRTRKGSCSVKLLDYATTDDGLAWQLAGRCGQGPAALGID